MEIEFQELDLRYESLRSRDLGREKRLLASLAASGQQAPIVVVRSSDPGRTYVVVDGYKRIRALRRLSRDTVVATCWELSEAEALIVHRLLCGAAPASALEQGWLLRDLSDRFGMRAPELARRFDRSVSWVSRRLGLVRDLPEIVQERVRAGEVVPHVAMKFLLPLARANAAHCLRLLEALGGQRVASRAMSRFYAAYMGAPASGRERLVAEPLLFLRADAHSRRTPANDAVSDLRVLAAVAARLTRRLADPVVVIPDAARDEGTALVTRTEQALTRAFRLWKERVIDAGRADTTGCADPGRERPLGASDREDAAHLARSREEHPGAGNGRGPAPGTGLTC